MAISHNDRYAESNCPFIAFNDRICEIGSSLQQRPPLHQLPLGELRVSQLLLRGKQSVSSVSRDHENRLQYTLPKSLPFAAKCRTETVPPGQECSVRWLRQSSSFSSWSRTALQHLLGKSTRKRADQQGDGMVP